MTRKILVVDDEPDMQLLIRQKFRKKISNGEFDFSFASNGREALEMIGQSADLDLVMTDINMPEMTGLELLDHVVTKNPMFKIIVASAYNDLPNIRSAMNKGAYDFITKPIDFKDLELTMDKCFIASDEIKSAKEAISERDEAVADKEKAETSEHFKKQFLANMSHEIRTPMNSVIGFTNLLKRTTLDLQQNRFVNLISSASEQLMSIINDILDISRIEAGKMNFEDIPFSLHEAIENVIEILAMRASEKNLELKTRFETDLPDVVSGDPHRLAQILINLIGNAIKFTSEGSITLIISHPESQEPFEGNKPFFRFEVTDTGIGIAPEKLGTIFESFTQAESDTSRKYGGTGLGLTISRQLVELQHGTIGVDSKLGEGTTFWFNIPYRIPEKHEIEGKDSEEGKCDVSGLAGIKILLVEDNEFNQMVAEDTLKEHISDVELTIAENGAIALDKLKESKFDLILMDIQMPVMSGYESMENIRRGETPDPEIPIIAMTANATPEEIKECFTKGADEYVPKPFETDFLFEKMNAVLKRKKVTIGT